MTFGPDPRNNPLAKDIVAEFKAKSFDPEAYTLYSYAAVQIMKQAAEKAKSLDPKKVAEAMHSGMTFNTVIGDISYDKKGDRTNVDYVWYVWRRSRTARSATGRTSLEPSGCGADHRLSAGFRHDGPAGDGGFLFCPLTPPGRTAGKSRSARARRSESRRSGTGRRSRPEATPTVFSIAPNCLLDGARRA